MSRTRIKLQLNVLDAVRREFGNTLSDSLKTEQKYSAITARNAAAHFHESEILQKDPPFLIFSELRQTTFKKKLIV